MSVIGSNILAGASGQSTGYKIDKSLRFRSSASASLQRTFASACQDAKKMTLSIWCKRGKISVNQPIISSYSAVRFGGDLYWYNDKINFRPGGNGDGASNQYAISTNAVYRDPSAWYHIVIQYDSTQATDTNRQKIFVNGVQQTVTGTYPPQNYLHTYSYQNQYNEIGSFTASGSDVLDGYLAEFNFIDGQALTPSSFGETSATTGVWQPKKYAGTYGTNGFYLPFTDNSALTTSSNVGLGKDFSGNGNYWTTNNISITSGATYDSMTDVPTLTSATASNYPVLNPLANSSATITNGNLSVSGGNDLPCTMVCPPSGHWYVEFNKSNITSAAHIGVYDATSTPATINKAILYAQNGGVFVNNSQVATFATYGNNDIVGMGVDIDTGNIYFSVNNTYQGSVGISSSGIATNNVVIGVRCNSGVTADINFGQRPFVYPPTSPVKSLNTFNLPTPTIGATASTQANKYMDISLYTGTGSTQTITNSGGFQPDFLWAKARSGAFIHVLTNAVTGSTNALSSNNTNAQITVDTTYASNGFTVNSDVNNSGTTYVGWQWKANGTGVTNTAGSITSTVSANTSSGFSVVTYTGTGSAATIGHGLGISPRMIIVKRRNSTGNWAVFHSNAGSEAIGFLNTTDAFSSPDTSYWNGTSPTSSVFSVGNNSAVNASGGTYVAYVFSQVAGYSSIGRYTGNGNANGTFVYTGFKPKFLLVKIRDTAGYGWMLVDGTRNTANTVNRRLLPNLSNAEDTDNVIFDFLSNGFKARDAGIGINENNSAYMYLAFAENPFKYSLAR